MSQGVECTVIQCLEWTSPGGGGGGNDSGVVAIFRRLVVVGVSLSLRDVRDWITDLIY